MVLSDEDVAGGDDPPARGTVHRRGSAPLTVPLRLLVAGHGRMGRLVETLAPEYGFEIAGLITRSNADAHVEWAPADVAIDFSTPSASPVIARALAARGGVSLVIGTTGWQAEEEALRRDLADMNVGVICAPNFAIGVNLFLAIIERAGDLLTRHDFASWIHEAHHAAKKDAPSGTALVQRVLERSAAHPHISSTRVGHSRARTLSASTRRPRPSP